MATASGCRRRLDTSPEVGDRRDAEPASVVVTAFSRSANCVSGCAVVCRMRDLNRLFSVVATAHTHTRCQSPSWCVMLCVWLQNRYLQSGPHHRGPACCPHAAADSLAVWPASLLHRPPMPSLHAPVCGEERQQRSAAQGRPTTTTTTTPPGVPLCVPAWRATWSCMRTPRSVQ